MYYMNMDCPLDIVDGHIVRNQWVEKGNNIFECSRCGEQVISYDIHSLIVCPHCNRRIGVRGEEIG